MTAEQNVAAIIDYVRSLAPQFLATRMKGATDADILRLEAAAGTRMSDGHREFLRQVGATPAGLLNPFLHDRDFCVDTLVAEYESWKKVGQTFPAGIVYFSASELTGSNIFLRHSNSLADDPEIGDIADDFRTFVINDRRTLESYLRWFAFMFRLGQFDHAVEVGPRWNPRENRWEGNPKRMREMLAGMGFTTRFLIEDGSEDLDGDNLAATFYSNGSVLIAGDDYHELVRLGDKLMAELNVQLTDVARRERLLAPRN